MVGKLIGSRSLLLTQILQGGDSLQIFKFDSSLLLMGETGQVSVCSCGSPGMSLPYLGLG